MSRISVDLVQIYNLDLPRENSPLGKYHCTAGLQFYKLGCNCFATYEKPFLPFLYDPVLSNLTGTVILPPSVSVLSSYYFSYFLVIPWSSLHDSWNALSSKFIILVLELDPSVGRICRLAVFSQVHALELGLGIDAQHVELLQWVENDETPKYSPDDDTNSSGNVDAKMVPRLNGVTLNQKWSITICRFYKLLALVVIGKKLNASPWPKSHKHHQHCDRISLPTINQKWLA